MNCILDLFRLYDIFLRPTWGSQAVVGISAEESSAVSLLATLKYISVPEKCEFVF